MDPDSSPQASSPGQISEARGADVTSELVSVNAWNKNFRQFQNQLFTSYHGSSIGLTISCIALVALVALIVGTVVVTVRWRRKRGQEEETMKRRIFQDYQSASRTRQLEKYFQYQQTYDSCHW